MNNPALKLAMAKLLPEKIDLEYDDVQWFFFWKSEPEVTDNTTQILETEWLYVMHLVEQSLNDVEIVQYHSEIMCEIIGRFSPDQKWLKSQLPSSKLAVFATFNQRATAMAKVKGIEI